MGREGTGVRVPCIHDNRVERAVKEKKYHSSDGWMKDLAMGRDEK